MNRRSFSEKMLKGATLMSLSPLMPSSAISTKAKDVLVLGGTYFLGPAVVNGLLNRGHKVTLFNRGITNPSLFPNLPHISGDRANGENGYEKLLSSNKNWDVIIDVWPQESHLVDEATELLKDRTDHYSFISSIAVYNDFSKPGIKEDAERVVLPENDSDWGYAEHKVNSENVVRARFPENHTILRCGPIKGWRDPAIDLPFWLTKIKAGEVVGPGDGSDVVQFVDVKDVGNFAALTVENGSSGTFNINGPTADSFTWKVLLEAAKNAINPDAKIYWAAESFLRDNGIRPWDQMPLWLPNRIDPGFFRIDVERSLNSGFQFSPVEKTLKDQFDWYTKHIESKGRSKFGLDENPGISSAKHKELLSKLKK